MTLPPRPLLLLLALALAAGPARAQLPGSPKPPEKYKVVLRYELPVQRDQHVMQYDAMVAHLKSLGFEFDPPLAKRPETDREDPTKTYLRGTIASARARQILQHEAIASVLLVPADFAGEVEKAPADTPVLARLELTGGLTIERQRELADQLRPILRELGFREAVAYEPRGPAGRPYARLVGTVPAGKLETYLKDLRGQPGGWLAPLIPRAELPLPLRSFNPVRLIEVLPSTEPIKDAAEAEPRSPEYLEKLSPELWDLAKAKEPPPGRIRVQAIFAGTPDETDRAWRASLLEAVPGLFIEGQLGQYVTGTLPVAQIRTLAALPTVVVVRTPPPVRTDVVPAAKGGDNAAVLEASGLAGLHRRGARGQNVRLAVVHSDFRGWEALVKDKKLPGKTRLVDLTAERSRQLLPAPYADKAAGPGRGTLLAQAAAVAAPDAEIVLVRIDPVAPYQLREVVRYVEGGDFSATVEARRDELVLARAEVREFRIELLKERAKVLENFADETELRAAFGLLGPAFDWLYSERGWHRQRMEYLERLEESLREREARFNALVAALQSLRGTHVVVNPFGWHDGYPLGGTSPLARWLDQSHAKRPLWFQPVGHARGQTWLGPFRTTAGSPVMEFTGPDDPLPAGRWTRELNFLTWQPHQGKPAAELPEKTKVRLSLQWREPHDPDYFLRAGEDDYYRRPLARLKLVLLRQRDPDARTLPADLFEVVARSGGLPQRLEHHPGGTIYEQTLEVTLEQAGRYALRIERQPDAIWTLGQHPESGRTMLMNITGLNPAGTRPLGTPTLPALEKRWELRPRLFVETPDDAARQQGRVVLGDFTSPDGGIGTPADARGVISVGAADAKGRPRPYSAAGAPPFMDLSRRPTVLSYDGLSLAAPAAGTDIAAAHAAGLAAAVLSGGTPREQLVELIRGQNGRVLAVTAGGGR